MQDELDLIFKKSALGQRFSKYLLMVFAGIPLSWTVGNKIFAREILLDTNFAQIHQLTFLDPVVSTDSSSIVLSFSRVGNLILLRAKADTSEGNFILDTGAPGLVLNLTYFRNYPRIAGGEVEQGGVTGAAQSGGTTLVKNMSFGGIRYSNIETHLVNLGHIENSKGIKILGLLGMDLLKKFEMIIDYDNSRIYIHLLNRKDPPGYCHEMLKDTSAYYSYPIELTENKIITRTEMAGKKLKFVIDTGAESNVLDSRLPGKVFDNVEITRRVLLAGTGNAKVEALYGDLKNMTIGNQNIATLPVLITNLEKMCTTYNCQLDGLLGYDFLSLHKVGFNFVSRKMFIWK